MPIQPPIASPIGSPIGSPLRHPVFGSPWIVDANFRDGTLKASGTTGGPYAQVTRNCTAWAQVWNTGDTLKWVELAANEAIRHGWRRISEGVWSNKRPDGTLIPEASRRDLVIEPEATNSLPYSRDLSHWNTDNTPTQNQIGFDGTPNMAWLCTDYSPAITYRAFIDTAIANDANPLVNSVLLKKDADNSGFVRIECEAIGGTPVIEHVFFNTSSGAVESEPIAGGSYHVQDLGDWWRVFLTVTNNGSGNVTNRFVVRYRANDVTTTGFVVLDQAELHLNKTIAEVKNLGPIVTNGSAVTKYADVPTIPEVGNLNQTAGAAIIEYTPLVDSADDTGDNGLVSLTTAAANLLYVDGTNGNIEATDGTNTATVSETLVDGTATKAAVRWGSELQVVSDGTAGTAQSYDGGITTDGTIRLGYGQRYPVAIHRLRIARRDLGTAKLVELTS